MGLVFFWIAIFSFTATASITLLGSRDLISGNMLEFKRLLMLLTNWKFIVSMAFALVSRMAFMMTNNSLLKIPRLAGSSTTITTFVTLISLLLVVIANAYFLKEKLNLTQGIGAALILTGAFTMLR